MRKFGIIASLLFLNIAGQPHTLAQDLQTSARSNESLVTLSIFGRCVGRTNELTVEWGGTANRFEIFYNGRILDTRTSPGILIFRPGTRVSKISVKACKNSVCDTDTQTWNGSDCSRTGTGTPDPL